MTPMRISFVGGGTDFKEYYQINNGGAVLNAAINKYVYIIINKYHDPKKCLLKYSKSEIVNKIKDIKHPLIKGCLIKMKIWGLDINSVADIPAGTGLGSSSSFTVGLLSAILCLSASILFSSASFSASILFLKTLSFKMI